MPGSSGPDSIEPDSSGPDSSEPDSSEPDSGESDSSGSDGAAPDPGDPNADSDQGGAPLHRVRSDALRAFGYDPERRVLMVRFSSGELYEYEGVDEGLYTRLIDAQPHPWSQLGEEVRSHDYRHVDPD